MDSRPPCGSACALLREWRALQPMGSVRAWSADDVLMTHCRAVVLDERRDLLAPPDEVVLALVNEWLASGALETRCRCALGRVDELTEEQQPPTSAAVSAPATSRASRAASEAAASAASATVDDRAEATNSEPYSPESRPEPPPDTARTWIEVELVGDDGARIGGVKFELVLPDGNKYVGETSATEAVRYDDLLAGDYALTFPDLDRDAWEIQKIL